MRTGQWPFTDKDFNAIALDRGHVYLETSAMGLVRGYEDKNYTYLLFLDLGMCN